MVVGEDSVDEAELLAEQIDFYRNDAEPFDRWLAELVAEDNHDAVARTYKAGRTRIAEVFERQAPLGRVLEIAAGTGRLVELYAAHADSVVLLDASPESLAIAADRLQGRPDIAYVEADIFEWDSVAPAFDTVIFTAWLHHVPHARLESFWSELASLLGPDGRVIFDFPDANIVPPGSVGIPATPAEGYGFYAPVDGVSVRDHFGRRWRVVHNLWDPQALASRLSSLGWRMTPLGPGLFGNIVWAQAHRPQAPDPPG